MGLYENVKEAAKLKGYSINKLEQELGFARSYIGKFKTITPSADKIQKIADFLDVSSEYLLTGKEKENEGYYLNEETAKLAQEMFEDEDMRSLFDMKRNMPPERFKAHMEFMKNLYNQEKGSN
ncbi:MAG: helix-turn-helix transcriptional regulator [Lachnospiraceae bacterium]|nr:helix-turn-helix transcriptional regulator [Lachnospiraceae bacterium]MBP3477553.1 helix-turn-helix transcriptional regulator [Lachnospiraceae bacterium]